MITVTGSMCRETRKLLETLDMMARGSSVTTLVTYKDVYIAEQLMSIYYYNPVINLIESRLKSIKNKSSKNFSPEYWTNIIELGFTNTDSVRRKDDVCIISSVNKDSDLLRSFELISKYLLVDYSTMDSSIILNMIHHYTADSISKAISIAKDNKVYHINYIKTVVEREQALANIKKQDIKKLADSADNAANILSDRKVSNTMTDLATATYNWQKALEDAELLRQMDELTRDK